MAGVDELSEKSNPLLGLHLMAQLGKTRVYVLKAQLKMDASKIVKEWEFWVLTWLHAN